MRYDIISALISDINPERVSRNLEKSCILSCIREMLPTSLESKVKKIEKGSVTFKIPGKCYCIKADYFSEAIKKEELGAIKDIIIFNSKIESEEKCFKSKEMISFSEKGKYNYSALEVLTSEDIFLVNCARSHVLNGKVYDADVYSFVYDKSITSHEAGEELRMFLNYEMLIDDFLETLFSINEKLKANFIIPDYYEGISARFEENIQNIDIDGEITRETSIPISDLNESSKKIISRLTDVLNDKSALANFWDIEIWYANNVVFRTFNSKYFIEGNFALLNNKKLKEGKQKIKVNGMIQNN